MAGFGFSFGKPFLFTFLVKGGICFSYYSGLSIMFKNYVVREKGTSLYQLISLSEVQFLDLNRDRFDVFEEDVWNLAWNRAAAKRGFLSSPSMSDLDLEVVEVQSEKVARDAVGLNVCAVRLDSCTYGGSWGLEFSASGQKAARPMYKTYGEAASAAARLGFTFVGERILG